MGLYAGYSLSLGAGTLVDGLLGWKWAYLLAAMTGLVVAAVTFFTVPEPRQPLGLLRRRQRRQPQRHDYSGVSSGGSATTVDDGDDGDDDDDDDENDNRAPLSFRDKLPGLSAAWLGSPALLLVCVAGGVRDAGGFVFGYYLASYFSPLLDGSPALTRHGQNPCSYSFDAGYDGDQVCCVLFVVCCVCVCVFVCILLVVWWK